MPHLNQQTREITCKLVYCGPGRSGKTTNLLYLHGRVPGNRRGGQATLAVSRTPDLDFLPLELGVIAGFVTRFQLFAVPGDPTYHATRRLILRGADGVIFVADSQARRFEDNLASLRNLEENLEREGSGVQQIPLVVQYNKQDLPPELLLSPGDLAAAFEIGAVPGVPADALHGAGVFETFKLVAGLVLRRFA